MSWKVKLSPVVERAARAAGAVAVAIVQRQDCTYVRYILAAMGGRAWVEYLCSQPPNTMISIVAIRQEENGTSWM